MEARRGTQCLCNRICKKFLKYVEIKCGVSYQDRIPEGKGSWVEEHSRSEWETNGGKKTPKKTHPEMGVLIRNWEHGHEAEMNEHAESDFRRSQRPSWKMWKISNRLWGITEGYWSTYPLLRKNNLPLMSQR